MLKPGTLLPQIDVLHEHGFRQKFMIIDYSASEERLELQTILTCLDIEQDQGNENLFCVSHPDIKNGQQFRLRFEPYGSDEHVPGLSDDELEKLLKKLNRLERSKLMDKLESDPYGFKLSYIATSPMQPEHMPVCPIRFYWESETNTAAEDWSQGMVKDNLAKLFCSEILGTLPLSIEIPYPYWLQKLPGPLTIKSNLKTKPDHFRNFVNTIDPIISELKKMAEKLKDPSNGASEPNKILEQLSDALDKVPHGYIEIKLIARRSTKLWFS